MNIITYLRQFRILNYAVFDFVVAFLGIFLLSPFLSRMFKKIGVEIPQTNWIFLTLPIGIVTHLLIGQMTPMTKNFLNLHDYYLLKLIILTLLILGLRGIKIIK